MSNKQIYDIASQIHEAFNIKDQYLPIKLNFYLQKNKKLLVELAQDIDLSRNNILQRYGTYDSEHGYYKIQDEQSINIVTSELDELFNLEQEVNVQMVPMSVLDLDLQLTTAQMEAIMFMIDDKKE